MPGDLSWRQSTLRPYVSCFRRKEGSFAWPAAVCANSRAHGDSYDELIQRILIRLYSFSFAVRKKKMPEPTAPVVNAQTQVRSLSKGRRNFTFESSSIHCLLVQCDSDSAISKYFRKNNLQKSQGFVQFPTGNFSGMEENTISLNERVSASWRLNWMRSLEMFVFFQ